MKGNVKPLIISIGFLFVTGSAMAGTISTNNIEINTIKLAQEEENMPPAEGGVEESVPGADDPYDEPAPAPDPEEKDPEADEPDEEEPLIDRLE